MNKHYHCANVTLTNNSADLINNTVMDYKTHWTKCLTQASFRSRLKDFCKALQEVETIGCLERYRKYNQSTVSKKK